MDRVQVGASINIKRSDGRVHSAIITEIWTQKSAVLVEWFEGGETKGKEVLLAELVAMNPPLTEIKNSTLTSTTSISKLTRRASTTSIDINGTICGMPQDEDENELLLPFKPAQKEATARRRTTLGVCDSNEALAFEPLEDIFKKPAPPPAEVQKRRALQPPKAAISPSAQRRFRPSLNSKTTMLPPPTPALSNNVMIAERKIQMMKQTVKPQNQREERQAVNDIKMKREMRTETPKLDPGHPNYHFSVMIQEYQANIDFRPLKITDVVNDNRISVCVRKRPLNKKESTKNDIEVVTVPNQDHVIVHQPQVKVDLTKYLDNQKFRFDYAFDENVDNNIVYRFTAQPLVKSIFEQGFATCFAYGQTGSGKTHTMGGDFSGKQQDWSKGIYALAAIDVFRLYRGEFRSLGLTVGCSFFEIYGGKVFDLLNNRNLLRVLENGKKEVQVVGLQEDAVTSDQQVLDLIRKGSDMRTAGATSANANSSRSHAVFQIILRRGAKLWGKFSLIDLAGSERGQDTGSSDRQTRMEGAEINKSLLALKECIRAMGRNSIHVPFRQSKLTMVLRDSFVGDNSRTCMIAMISPTVGSCEHTLNTLRYADRVKELGCDDGENAAPLADDELMLANPGTDVEDVLQAGQHQEKPKYEKVLAAITQCEEKSLNDLYNYQEGIRSEERKISEFLQHVQDPDYDMKKFTKGLIEHLEQQLADRRAMLENANRWLMVIQQENELSTSGVKK